MGIEEKINLFATGMILGISLTISSGFYLTRSFESGEWNLKKQNAIYSEYWKFKKNERPDTKDYFDLASEALDLTNYKKYYLSIAEIRGKIGKTNLDVPLLEEDFKKYILEQRNNKNKNNL